MSPRTHDESGYRHYLRVRMGINGPKGRLLKCKKRDNSGTYWKVHLDDGKWVWPDGLVLDGPGDRVATCADCGIPFMSDGSSPLCPNCDESAFGTRARRSGPADTRSHRASLYGTPTPIKPPGPIDEEAATEQRRQDKAWLDKESPY